MKKAGFKMIIKECGRCYFQGDGSPLKVSGRYTSAEEEGEVIANLYSISFGVIKEVLN